MLERFLNAFRQPKKEKEVTPGESLAELNAELAYDDANPLESSPDYKAKKKMVLEPVDQAAIDMAHTVCDSR
jgi:hypothetical protein